MFDFMQPADKPVVEGLESQEVVYAANQPEYNPLRVLRSKEGVVLTRWTLTEAQHTAIANGADIYLEISTFNRPLQPIRMAVGSEVDPEYIREQYGLEKP